MFHAFCLHVSQGLQEQQPANSDCLWTTEAKETTCFFRKRNRQELFSPFPDEQMQPSRNAPPPKKRQKPTKQFSGIRRSSVPRKKRHPDKNGIPNTAIPFLIASSRIRPGNTFPGLPKTFVRESGVHYSETSETGRFVFRPDYPKP